MTSIESIQLDRLVIHGVNNLADTPDIADREETLSEGLRHFFEEHISNCLKSTSALTAKFTSAEGTIATCCAEITDRPETFVEQCRVLGLWYAHNAAKSARVQTFLAIALFTDLDTDDRYLSMLQLDPVNAYIKRRDTEGFDQTQILPDPARPLGRWAIVRPCNEETRYDVLYRAQSSSRDDDPASPAMWLEGFLEAADIPSPKRLTQLVVKETEKWISQNSETLDDKIALNLRNAVRTTAQSEEMDVEAIADQTLPEEQREGYVRRLMDKGLTETVFNPDREWAERSARKTTYLCDSGVQVSGPSDSIDEVVQMLPKTPDRKTRLVVETRKFEQK